MKKVLNVYSLSFRTRHIILLLLGVLVFSFLPDPGTPQMNDRDVFLSETDGEDPVDVSWTFTMASTPGILQDFPGWVVSRDSSELFFAHTPYSGFSKVEKVFPLFSRPPPSD